jgi:hypothetical protein
VQANVKDWVDAGGTLWATYAALSRDEFDEPCHLLDATFGLEKRGTPMPTPLSYDQETASRVIRYGDLSIVTSPARPDWSPTPAAVALATFADDGSPALLGNRPGTGRTFLYGSTVLPLTSGYNRIIDEPADGKAKRELVAMAAEAAGIAPQAWTSHPRVLAQISDGPSSSILFVMNVFDGDHESVEISAALPWKPAELMQDDGATIDFTHADGVLRFTIPLASEDGHMYRLKKP